MKKFNELTMSSREIAELTGKEIKHVHRNIKTQLFECLYGLKDGPNLDHEKIQGVTIESLLSVLTMTTKGVSLIHNFGGHQEMT